PGTTHVESILMLQQFWLGNAVRIVEEGTGVEPIVAIVVVRFALIAVATTRSGKFDLRNAQSFIGSCILSSQRELSDAGHAGSVDAEERVSTHQVIVDFDTVPGNV